MSVLDPVLDLFRGRTITVPPLDGAFRPDTALDDAPVALPVTAPDDLVLDAAGRLLIATGKLLLVGAPGSSRAEPLARFECAISAILTHRDGCILGLEDGRLMLVDAAGAVEPLPILGLACPVAFARLDETTILVAQGSARHRPADWARDLMEHGASGSVWRVDLKRGSGTRIADGLAWPYGLAVEGNGQTAVVAESWRHRLVRIPLAGLSGGSRAQAVLTALPGYPARLEPAADGGWWLALFAPRNRLVEFVLTERAYRRAMLAEVDPSLWIAPALSPARTFLEPLQCGGVRTMGVSKAWAPTRSYGLVARLDERFRPLSSRHSRANGSRHGVTGLLDLGDRLLVASKGGDAILSLPAGDPA